MKLILRQITITVITWSIFFYCAGDPCITYAQGSYNSPEEMKEAATGKINLAREFINRAQQLLRNAPDKDNCKIAIYLYKEAAQLYDHAARMYKVLEDKYYIGPEYSQGARDAVQKCVDAMNKCRQRIMRL